MEKSLTEVLVLALATDELPGTDTCALFTSEPPAVAVSLIVTMEVAPALIAPRLQLTVPFTTAVPQLFAEGPVAVANVPLVTKSVKTAFVT